MENIYKGFNKGSIKSHYLLVTDFLYDLFLSKKHSTPRHILLVLYDEAHCSFLITPMLKCNDRPTFLGNCQPKCMRLIPRLTAETRTV